jgi:bacterioferritin-associated ferredoxin
MRIEGMYICVCGGVTESQIRTAIHEGAHTVDALARRLGVGIQCASCVDATQWLLEEVHEEMGERRSRAPLSLVISNR